MKLEIFAVYDDKLGAYMQPFFAQTIGAATRSFQDACVDNSTPMSKHPEDYRLHHLGSWEDTNAKFKNADEPRELARAIDFTTKPN